MAIKRIYVPAKLRDDFIDSFCAVGRSLVVGDGLNKNVTLGPLHTKSAQTRARSLLDDALRRGATAKQLGTISDEETFAEGHFVRPTLVLNVPDDAPLVVEEQFCPIIPVMVYEHLDNVIARANDSIFGLGASVWSNDRFFASKVARRIETGQVWINAHGPRAINHHAAYGGIKQSGIGRRSGMEGILEYLQSQAITTHNP